MKLALLLPAVVLAVTSLAAVPLREPRDVGNTTIPTKAPGGNFKHVQNVTFVNNTAAGEVDELFNATVTGMDTASWPEDEYAVDIRTGGPKIHVGTLRKHRIYNSVYECLKLIGQQGNGVVKDKISWNWDPELCSSDKWYFCQRKCEIPNIVYEAGKGKYATNAHIKIETTWSELWESKHAGIRNLAYKLVADIYRLATENDANCYWVNFETSRKTKICNVPANVLAVWPARGNAPVQARINIQLYFNGKTEFGGLDCNSGLRTIAYHFKDNVRPEMAKVMGWPENKIRLFNSCQKKECFDVRDGYWPGKPWKEPRNCDTPEHYWEEIS